VLPERCGEWQLQGDYDPLVHGCLDVGVDFIVSTLEVPLSK